MRIISMDEIRERYQIVEEYEAAMEAANAAYWKSLDDGVTDDDAWRLCRFAEVVAHDNYIAALDRLLGRITAE